MTAATANRKQCLIEFAEALERMAKRANEPPADGYTSRVIELGLWDECDSGGENLDGIEFEDGDAQLLALVVREAAAREP